MVVSVRLVSSTLESGGFVNPPLEAQTEMSCLGSPPMLEWLHYSDPLVLEHKFWLSHEEEELKLGSRECSYTT